MTPQINLIHLKYFFDAVSSGSVSQAARNNFVSQSAISQGIMRLEVALKVSLTTHQKQGISVTEEGRIVYNESKKIFAAMEELQNRLNDLKGEITGTVKFACTNAIAQFYIANYYMEIKRTFPKISLKFTRGGLNYLHNQLREEEVSFIIALDSPEFSNYDKVVLKQGYFKLYRRKEGSISDCIFFDHYENEEVKEFFCRYNNKYKKEIPSHEALSSWGMVERFVQNGAGIGYLPDFILSGNDLIEEVDMRVSLIRYEICAFKLKGSVLTRSCSAVVEELTI